VTEDAARREAEGVTLRRSVAELWRAKQRRRRWRDFRRRDAAEGRKTEATGRLPNFPVCFSTGACLTRSAKRVPREPRTRVPRTVRGVEDTTESVFLCAVFLFCTRDGGTSLGTTVGRGDEASLPAAGFYARSQRRVRGNTRPCFEGALTREAGAPSQNGRAPPPGGWWRKGECLGQVSEANTLEGRHRART